MASSDFDDDNLVQSYPFLASILLIFIIIFLILSLKRIFYEVPFSNDKKYKNCKCKKCIERYNNFIQYTKKENINTTFYVYLAITVICAICFAILCVKIANTKKKVSVQAHHSFVDGLHIGQFVDELQRYLDEF